MADRDREPLDEDAAWAEIVAAYDEETAPAEHDRPYRWTVEQDTAADGTGTAGTASDTTGDDRDTTDPTDTSDGPESRREGPGGPGGAGSDGPTRSITVLSAGSGPRDWTPAEPASDGQGEDDDHFVPPEPPPLPRLDMTTRFGWLGALGGPLLLLGAVVLQQPLTWWIVTLGIGGFLGGFATLVTRLRDEDDDEDFDDPGRGAVV